MGAIFWRVEGVNLTSTQQAGARLGDTYNARSLSERVPFYKVAENTELVNTESSQGTYRVGFL